jgi:alkanesulfonate monooxygenase SsuD/methylene tetrahydromethanopterin reductase-like flavin-dependent oxidoreductase (luciferase family)
MTTPRPGPRSGPGGSGAAAEYGDVWMPEVEDLAEFEAQVTEVRRLCAEAGRPGLEVTAFAWEPDERLMARCAELGVSRFAVWAPIQELDALSSFLDGYAGIADLVAP